MTGDLNDCCKAHVKTQNGKWNGMKNGAFIGKLGYINLVDAIGHVELGNTIECVLYNISYDYFISFHYSFCFSFRVLFCSCCSKHPDFCVYIQKSSRVFLPFLLMLSCENILLISARS
jgi:hypothetical protein